MASSGSFSGSIKDGHYILRVDWSQSQNVSANTSTITCKLYLVNDWSLDISGRTDNTCTIDGTSHTYSSGAVSSKGTHLLDTVTQTVSHSSDGSKSLSISAVFNIRATLSGTYYSSITASATITLDSIPRASSFASVSGTVIGSSCSVTISRASTAFTHQLWYKVGSSSWYNLGTGIETSKTFTIAMETCSQYPNATGGTMQLCVRTYSGSTQIGSDVYKSVTVTIPDSVKPTIGSLTAARIDGDVPSSWGIYVQTKSKAKVTIGSASGSYGSTIKSYSISGGGYSSTTSSLTTGYLNSSGTVTFTATVTDSRGRTSSAVTVSISVVAYAAPYFTSYSSQRCASGGTLSDEGTYVKGTVKFGFYSCSSKNSVTRAVYYRAVGASSWTDAGVSFTSGTAFTFGGGTVSTETSYEIKYTLTDAFTTTSVIDVVSTASVVMDFKSGGKGVAVGKVSETDNCFEVSEDWDVRVYGMLLKAYIQSLLTGGVVYGTCSTSAGTAAKTVSKSGFTLTTGAMIAVKFTYANTVASPTLNVNSTGAKSIVTFGTSVIGTYYWKPGQTVFFVYDGTYWVALNMSIATTTYYGITKLSSSTNSTSTAMAATPSAVKAAYDRNSWTSISLTNALAIAYGGTGATTAAAARTNLGITATSLYSGTLTTGSTTFSLSYKLFVIIGQVTSSGSRLAFVIPSSQITTSATSYQIADESYYYSFNLSYSGSTVTLAYKNRSSSGQIIRIYGVN